MSMADKLETVVPISDLQVRSRALVDQVRKTGTPIVITQRGRPAAMLVNYDLYEGHLAVLDETSHPDWKQRLARARAEVAGAELTPHAEVARRPRKPAARTRRNR
jgi:prevent-host-death family protein